jgi:hydrogenase maturation protease
MVAQLTGHYPQRIVLIGCQPEELEDYGGSLRPRTLQALEEALPLALERLQQWGACPVPRSRPLEPAQATTAAHLRLNAYEAGRPSAEEACRIGDARFIPR